MKNNKARLAFETTNIFRFMGRKITTIMFRSIVDVRSLLVLILSLYTFSVLGQTGDSLIVKNFGLKGTVHQLNGNELYPNTIIDSVLVANIGMNCNQYMVKYFCEYQKMGNYKRKLGVKSPDYPLQASRFKMPNIFINGKPIVFFEIEELQRYVKIIEFKKGFTKGLSKNPAIYFELD